MKQNPYAKLGLGFALLTVALDQGFKWWMLKELKIGELSRIEVTGFFDLVLVWNPGISYGLFPQGSVTGQWLLILFSCLVICLLLVWLFRSVSGLVAISLGLIIGGAAGNAIDRAVYAAVADFFSFHGFGYYWYVFNLADTAIVAGAAGLIYDSLFTSHKSAANGR